MTTASHHHGPDAGDSRTWIMVVAAAGWVAVTTVAVLLATGAWSVDQVISDDRGEPGRVQPGTDSGTDGPRNAPVPDPRSPTSPPPRPPTPRADHEGLVYAGSPLALLPRQPAAHDR